MSATTQAADITAGKLLVLCAAAYTLSLVGNVETPTMVVVGAEDYRTPVSESEQYYTALRLRGVPTALVRPEDLIEAAATLDELETAVAFPGFPTGMRLTTELGINQERALVRFWSRLASNP